MCNNSKKQEQLIFKAGQALWFFFRSYIHPSHGVLPTSRNSVFFSLTFLDLNRRFASRSIFFKRNFFVTAWYWKHLISEKKSKLVKKRWQQNLPNVGSENAAKVANKNPPKCKQIQSSHSVNGLVKNHNNYPPPTRWVRVQ